MGDKLVFWYMPLPNKMEKRTQGSVIYGFPEQGIFFCYLLSYKEALNTRDLCNDTPKPMMGAQTCYISLQTELECDIQLLTR